MRMCSSGSAARYREPAAMIAGSTRCPKLATNGSHVASAAGTMPPRWSSPSTVGTQCSCGSSVASHQALCSAAMTSMHRSVSASVAAGRLVAGAVPGEILEHEHEVAGVEIDLGGVARGHALLQPIGELAEEADLALVHVEGHRHGPVGDRRGGALDDDRRDRSGFGLVLQVQPGDDAEHPGALTDRLGPEDGRPCASRRGRPRLGAAPSATPASPRRAVSGRPCAHRIYRLSTVQAEMPGAP